MIPAPPRISAPPRPRVPPPPPPATRPKANDADISHLPPRHKRFPQRLHLPFPPGLIPPAASSPPAVPPVPGPLPAPLGGAPSTRAFRPRLSTRSARAFPPAPLRSELCPGFCRVSSTMLVHRARHHAYLSTLTPQPDGYLCLEQSNECGSLPHRFGRAPHSLKVSSRGGVAAGVSGGREDDAAGETAQGSGLVLGGRPSLGIVLGTPQNGLVGDSEDLAPRRA
jgi:hypothetical protein